MRASQDRQTSAASDRQPGSSEREGQVIHDPLRNRILLREVNERIRDLRAVVAAEEPTVLVFCECGSDECLERIEVPASLYERVRMSARQFLIAIGHEVRGHERVVETGRSYAVVR